MPYIAKSPHTISKGWTTLSDFMRLQRFFVGLHETLTDFSYFRDFLRIFLTFCWGGGFVPLSSSGSDSRKVRKSLENPKISLSSEKSVRVSRSPTKKSLKSHKVCWSPTNLKISCIPLVPIYYGDRDSSRILWARWTDIYATYTHKLGNIEHCTWLTLYCKCVNGQTKYSVCYIGSALQ